MLTALRMLVRDTELLYRPVRLLCPVQYVVASRIRCKSQRA
jgi:hypothetical protein